MFDLFVISNDISKIVHISVTTSLIINVTSIKLTLIWVRRPKLKKIKTR